MAAFGESKSCEGLRMMPSHGGLVSTGRIAMPSGLAFTALFIVQHVALKLAKSRRREFRGLRTRSVNLNLGLCRPRSSTAAMLDSWGFGMSQADMCFPGQQTSSSFECTAPPSFQRTVPPSFQSGAPPSFQSAAPLSFQSTVPPSFHPPPPGYAASRTCGTHGCGQPSSTSQTAAVAAAADLKTRQLAYPTHSLAAPFRAMPGLPCQGVSLPRCMRMQSS